MTLERLIAATRKAVWIDQPKNRSYPAPEAREAG